MKREIDERLALFAANAQTIKKGFIWQDAMTKRLAALLYALENKSIDCDAIRECHRLIKDNTGMFSMFRGNMSLCVAAMLSLQGNREELFRHTMSVYDMLKNVKFRSSDYLAVAAYQIATNANSEQYQHVAKRAKMFYDGMKARHFFHTGQDDYIYAAMLGLSDIDVEAGTERIEQLYQRLKSEFWSGSSVQALSQVLVLGGKSDDSVHRILSLRDALRSWRIKLDKMYTLPALGVLALLPVDADSIAQDILDARDFLRTQKGFGAFSVTTQELLLFSAAIAASCYAEDMKNDIITASVSTSIASIIIAQQTAIIVAASASTAAATAAASSSH